MFIRYKKHQVIILAIVISFLSLTILAGEKRKGHTPIKENKKAMYEILYLDLEKSFGIALNNNFELKSINAKKHIFDLNIKERIRDYFPTLSLSYLNTEDVRLRESDTRQHKLSIDSEIVIYDGGKRGLSYDIAKLESVLARNDYRIAFNRLFIDVIEAYLQILQLKGTIEIHKKTFERGKLQLKLINKEYELGDVTKLNVLEIETKIKKIELELEQTKGALNIALNKFKLLLKLDWRQPIDVIGNIESDFILDELDKKANVYHFVAIALKNRKEIESSEVELAISKRNHLINKLYYFPKFSIGLNYSLSGEKFFPREKGWGFNIKVTSSLFGNTGNLSTGYNESNNGNTRTNSNSGSVNVLDNMSYKRNIVDSKINMNTAADKKENIDQQVSIEVESSFLSLRDSWNMITIAKKQLELYDTQLKIERLKANMGETIRYELMKKEIERGEAAISYLDSLVRYQMSIFTLETAMGVEAGFLKLSKIKAR